MSSSPIPKCGHCGTTKNLVLYRYLLNQIFLCRDCVEKKEAKNER